MLAFLGVLVIGVLIGLIRGGSLANASTSRLRLAPLALVAVGLQAAAQFVPERWSFVAYLLVVVSYAALFAFAGANWRIAGMAFIALGAAMNYTVILANSGMPISAEAAARAGWHGEAAERLVVRGKHFIDHGEDARLRFLGDVITLGRAPSVASVGDLVIWAGMILLVQDLVKGPKGRRSVEGREPIERGDSSTSSEQPEAEDARAHEAPSESEPRAHVKVVPRAPVTSAHGVAGSFASGLKRRDSDSERSSD